MNRLMNVSRLAVPLLAALSGGAEADIVLGPWTFDDAAFADQASQIGGGSTFLYCGATTVDDALTGFSPDAMVANIGAGSYANHFELRFDDLLAVNLAGPDLVFFEGRFSADSFEIAVRPSGGVFTPFQPFLSSQFQFTNLTNSCGGEVWGVEIELDQYGIPSGGLVDAIQFRCISAEGDPLMAGVLHGAPECLAPLGAGCPGSGGFTPLLTTALCPVAGQLFSLSVEGGLGGSTALFVFGAGASPTPVGGGCTLDVGPLLPLTLAVPLGGVGPGNGQVTLATVLPAGLPPSSIGIQGFVLDPLPAIGASATPGYILVIG